MAESGTESIGVAAGARGKRKRKRKGRGGAEAEARIGKGARAKTESRTRTGTVVQTEQGVRTRWTGEGCKDGGQIEERDELGCRHLLIGRLAD